MTEEANVKRAKSAYVSLCEMLDDEGWRYEKDEEKFTIKCSARGDDLPFELRIEVDPKKQLVSLISHMPYAIPESRRTAIAVAVCQANNGLPDGGFDFDYLDGDILYRQTSSFRESLIGKELFRYLLGCACYTIDNYNDKFLMVSKSDMSVDEVVEYIK